MNLIINMHLQNEILCDRYDIKWVPTMVLTHMADCHLMPQECGGHPEIKLYSK
jgi:hypothetical protein